MKNCFKTILWTTAISWACFSASTASAALEIVDVNMDPLNWGTPYTSQSETMYVAVTLADSAVATDVNIDPTFGGSSLRPTLSFVLHNKEDFTKTATVVAKYVGLDSSSGDPSALDTIYFAYTPAPTDYKKGATIPTGTLLFRSILSTTGLSIRDLNGGSSLGSSGQYSSLTATAVNTSSVSLGVEINMYKVESPNSALGVSVNSGSSIQVVVKRATGAEGNTNELKLVAQSNNGALATVLPAAQTITS